MTKRNPSLRVKKTSIKTLLDKRTSLNQDIIFDSAKFDGFNYLITALANICESSCSIALLITASPPKMLTPVLFLVFRYPLILSEKLPSAKIIDALKFAA